MLKKIFKKTAAIIAAAAMLVTGTCTTYSGSESIIRTEQITAEAATTEKSPEDRMTEEALKYKGWTQSQMIAEFGKNFKGAWCCWFQTTIARCAGLDYAIPNGGGCTTLYHTLIKDYGAKVVSEPQKGDLLFYYCPRSGKYEHICLVVETRNGKVSKVIHGNYDNKVCLVNGTAYYDYHGHSVNNGIRLIYVHPNYEKNDNNNTNKNNTCIKLQSGMKVRLIAKCAPNFAIGCTENKNFGNVKLLSKYAANSIWTVYQKGNYFYFKNEKGYLLDCYGNSVKSKNNVQIHKNLCDTSLFTVKYEGDHCYLMFKGKNCCIDCFGNSNWGKNTNIWCFSFCRDLSQQFIVEKV